MSAAKRRGSSAEKEKNDGGKHRVNGGQRATLNLKDYVICNYHP